VRAVLQVEKQILDEGNAVLGVVVFADRLNGAELERGLPPRLGGRHTGAHVLFCLEGEMFAQALVGTAFLWRD
jgi:hypothetical protein